MDLVGKIRRKYHGIRLQYAVGTIAKALPIRLTEKDGMVYREIVGVNIYLNKEDDIILDMKERKKRG